MEGPTAGSLLIYLHILTKNVLVLIEDTFSCGKNIKLNRVKDLEPVDRNTELGSHIS